MRWGALYIAIACLILGTGCRARQLQRDQDHMRSALLDLYTNQLMDNLIRAHDGMPIVQLDYKDMTGTVTHSATGGISQNQTLETSRNQLAVTTARNFANFFGYSLGGTQENQLTVTADPVLNNNEVYDAYLEFLEKPERFVVGCESPPPGAAHIVRCVERPDPCGKKHAKTVTYYWIPIEFRHDFLRLALVTTVQRGQPLEVPQFFENTVVKVEDTTLPAQKDQKLTRLTVHLDNPIRNDSGVLRLVFQEQTLEFRLDMLIGSVEGKPVKRGDKVSTLWLLLPQEGLPKDFTAEKVASVLTWKKVKIELDNYKPTVRTTDELLKSISRNTTIIRLNQSR